MKALNRYKTTLRKTEKLGNEYDIVKNASDQIARYALVGAIMVFENRKLSPSYIKKFINDYSLVMSMDNLFGAEIDGAELMKKYEEKYGIDFNEITINLESKDEFIRRNS